MSVKPNTPGVRVGAWDRRRARSGEDRLHDAGFVDGVVQGLPDARVVEGLLQVVDDDVVLLQARDRRDLQGVLGGQPGDVEIRNAAGAVDVAALQHRHAGGHVGHEQDPDAVEIGLALLPIFVVALEERVLALRDIPTWTKGPVPMILLPSPSSPFAL